MDDPRLLGPIPTPPAQRWREIRLLYLPRTAFALGVLAAAWLWTHSVIPATIVAEADGAQADVRSARAGIVASLTVSMFERVRAGDTVGYVKPIEPRAADAAPVFSVKGADPVSKSAELASAPVPLVAPIDGVISVVLRRPGEQVAAGDAVLRITSRRAERLTGFLRQPLPFEPKVGMAAEIRTRGLARQSAMTTVTGVGVAMEAIPASLVAAMRLPDKPAPEHALRIHLGVPDELKLRPGEHVDVIIR